MPLAIVLVVVLVVLCLSGIVIWARLAATNRRTIDVPAGELEQFFWGGVMCRYVITSGTLARLEFFDWGVRLRGIPISRWLVPTWEARYDELALVELVALQHSRIAVWLKVRGGAGAIAFLSERSPEILPLLEKHGVQVSRTVIRIRRVEELYQ
jgi:hypothetical protein